MNLKKLSGMGLLTCIALIIFVVEMQIPMPVPVPGMKPGLANIVTVFAVYMYSPAEAFLILLARIILGSIFSGNISALIFSISGGILSLSGMLFFRKLSGENHICICSAFGAVLHNIGQIIAAAAVTGTLSVLAYLPVLTLFGCIAGVFTGICAQLTVKRLGGKMK